MAQEPSIEPMHSYSIYCVMSDAHSISTIILFKFVNNTYLGQTMKEKIVDKRHYIRLSRILS